MSIELSSRLIGAMAAEPLACDVEATQKLPPDEAAGMLAVLQTLAEEDAEAARLELEDRLEADKTFDPFKVIGDIQDPSEAGKPNRGEYAAQTVEYLHTLEGKYPGIARGLTMWPFNLRYFQQIPETVLTDQYKHIDDKQTRAGALIIANDLGPIIQSPSGGSYPHRLAWNTQEIQSLHNKINTRGQSVQLRLFQVSNGDELTDALNAGADVYDSPWEFAIVMGHGGDDGGNILLDSGRRQILDSGTINMLRIRKDALQPDAQALLVSCSGGNPDRRSFKGEHANTASSLAMAIGRTVIAAPRRHMYDTLGVRCDIRTGLLQPRVAFAGFDEYGNPIEINPVAYNAGGSLEPESQRFKGRRSQFPWHGVRIPTVPCYATPTGEKPAV